MKNFRLTGIRFNLFLGLISCFGFPILNPNIPLGTPSWWVALLGILFYVGELWAFNYKVRISRARILRRMTHNTPGLLNVSHDSTGCLIFYGFLMRFVFRIGMILVISGACGMDVQGDEEDVSVLTTIVMITGVVFELIVFGYSLYETRVYSSKPKSEQEEEEENESEIKWRTKHFPWLDDPKYPLKELGADMILFVFAILLTKAFWDPSNAGFVDFIRRSATDGTSGLVVFGGMIIANLTLCLFFLVPVRLAYWVEESMMVFSGRDRWKYTLSLIFAGFMITGPVWVEIFRVYF